MSLFPYIEDGDDLQLYCHGSDQIQATIMGYNTSDLILTCSKLDFVTKDDYIVDVEALTCSRKHEPHIIRTEGSNCSSEGADGRTKHLSAITYVQVGWMISSIFHPQYELCVDEMWYSTLWTSYSILGASIGLKDTKNSGKRPKFRKDITGHKRLFLGIKTQKALKK